MATSDRIQKEYASTAQILEVQHEIGRALERLPKNRANQILGNKNAYRSFVRAILMDLEIPTQTEAVMLQLQGIVDFYKKVCDTDVSSILEYEEIFLREDAGVFGLVVKSVSIADMADAFKGQKEWGISFSHYSDLSRIKNHQVRPDKELQLFVHKGGVEPDQEFLNTSISKFMKMDKLFASALEYMAMQGIARHTTRKWLDQKGWTRTTSLWPRGDFVHGRFSPYYSKLMFARSAVVRRDPGFGPRQLFLL